MTRSQGCAQSTAVIMGAFDLITRPVAYETCAVGGMVDSKALIGALPWGVIAYSGLSIIQIMLGMIGSPSERSKLSIISLVFSSVALESGIEATQTSFNQTGNIADLSGFFLRLTLLSAASTIMGLGLALTLDSKDPGAKKQYLKMAMVNFISMIGMAALAYGHSWGWAVYGAGNLLAALSFSIPVLNFFANMQGNVSQPQADIPPSQGHVSLPL